MAWSDDIRADEIDRRGRNVWGDVEHSDGTTTRVESNYGPNAGYATGSDGRSYKQDLITGEWHDDPAQSSGQTGNIGFGQWGGGGSYVPTQPMYVGGRPSLFTMIVASSIFLASQATTRAQVAWTNYPVVTSAFLFAFLAALVAWVFAKSYRGEIGIGGIVSLLAVGGAWIFPGVFGLAALPLVISSLLQGATEAIRMSNPWTAGWLPFLVGSAAAFSALNRLCYCRSTVRFCVRGIVFAGVGLWCLSPAIDSVSLFLFGKNCTINPDILVFLKAMIPTVVGLVFFDGLWVLRRVVQKNLAASVGG